MKLNMTVECTPEEARAFLGLPDLTPVNETLVSAGSAPNEVLPARARFMQMMTAGARAATADAPAKKG